jgi:uncharacterized membrane protein
MIMDRKLLKQNAKQNFKKDWFKSAVVTIIMFGASLVSSILTVPQTVIMASGEQYVTTSTSSFLPMLLSVLVFSVLTVGGYRYFQKTRKNIHTDIGEVTGNFKDGNYWNLVKISFLKKVKIILWSCLFLIPGLIKTFEYFLIEYILAVRPDIDQKSAFSISKKLMDGHKMDAFVLGLSFIGWYFLSSFTFGLLNLAYVNPYLHATYNEFYSFLRAEGIRNGIITPMDLPDYEAPSMNMGFDFAPQQETGFAQPQQGFYQPQENYNQPQESYNQPQEPFDNN